MALNTRKENYSLVDCKLGIKNFKNFAKFFVRVAKSVGKFSLLKR